MRSRRGVDARHSTTHERQRNLLDFLVGCGFVVGGLCGLYRLAETQRWFTWPMLIFDCLFVVDYSYRDNYRGWPMEAAGHRNPQEAQADTPLKC